MCFFHHLLLNFNGFVTAYKVTLTPSTEQYKGAYKDFIKNVEEDSEKWKDYF